MALPLCSRALSTQLAAIKSVCDLVSYSALTRPPRHFAQCTLCDARQAVDERSPSNDSYTLRLVRRRITRLKVVADAADVANPIAQNATARITITHEIPRPFMAAVFGSP